MDTLKTESYSRMYIRGIFRGKSTEKKVYLCVVGVRGTAQKDRLCGRTVYSLGLSQKDINASSRRGHGERRGGGEGEKNIDIRLGSEYF